MTEIFSISELFKQYILSVDAELRTVFNSICLEGTKFTLDEYCTILKNCIENKTTYDYYVICWQTKTSYENYNSKVYVNKIVPPAGQSGYSKLNSLSYLDTAYYHLDNTIDDTVSTYSVSKSTYGLTRSYTFENFLINGGCVFILLPTCKISSIEEVRKFYKNIIKVDIYNDIVGTAVCKLCNGWYKYLLASLKLVPSRKIFSLYKKHKCIYCKTNINNVLTDKPLSPHQVILTTRYEKL